MKILDQGKPPENRQDWWTAVELACLRCGCRWQLEPGDEQAPGVSIIQVRRIDGPGIITMPCPNCGVRVQHDSTPNGRGRDRDRATGHQPPPAIGEEPPVPPVPPRKKKSARIDY